jgi:hypothetical protein
MKGIDERPPERLSRLVEQVCALEELLLQALFKHEHGS